MDYDTSQLVLTLVQQRFGDRRTERTSVTARAAGRKRMWEAMLMLMLLRCYLWRMMWMWC
jgi:hypothetical protein